MRYGSTRVIEKDDGVLVVEGTLSDESKVYDVCVGIGAGVVEFHCDSEGNALDLAAAIRKTVGRNFLKEGTAKEREAR